MPYDCRTPRSCEPHTAPWPPAKCDIRYSIQDCPKLRLNRSKQTRVRVAGGVRRWCAGRALYRVTSQPHVAAGEGGGRAPLAMGGAGYGPCVRCCTFLVPNNAQRREVRCRAVRVQVWC